MDGCPIVAVVKVSEESPDHGIADRVEVFSDMDKASSWIEGEIDRLVAEHGHDRERDVDGWSARLADDYSHIGQYVVEELPVKMSAHAETTSPASCSQHSTERRNT